MTNYRTLDDEGVAIGERSHASLAEAHQWAASMAGGLQLQRWVEVGAAGHWSTVFPHLP